MADTNSSDPWASITIAKLIIKDNTDCILTAHAFPQQFIGKVIVGECHVKLKTFPTIRWDPDSSWASKDPTGGAFDLSSDDTEIPGSLQYHSPPLGPSIGVIRLEEGRLAILFKHEDDVQASVSSQIFTSATSSPNTDGYILSIVL
ncbi:hypothetical protein CTheo_6349 [Ceratobasidium theobromae]|uniref:Uncharacterized protein n=1 Tax=Ceratobasidium theobromae TaxID=1582974 RepID=A0A5N5QEM4_9AGAM|nr:hypothetical protein CTheo_6349 [Ceratobasidium theobromae]